MHILIISTYGFDPHFPSRPEFLLARTLATLGHRVSAIEYHHNPSQPRQEAYSDNLTIYRCGTFGFFSRDLWQLARTLPTPDIIHVHHLRHLLAFQAQMHWRNKVAMVLTPHGILHDGDLVVDRERPLEHPLRPERLLMSGAQLRTAIMQGAHPRRSMRNYLIHAPLRGYHGIMALTQHEKNVLVGLQIPADHITVIPNAVEFQQYITAVQPPRSTQPTILFIGQLVPRKGWDLAVRALPIIAESIADICMVMVTHNTSQQNEFVALANRLGVTDRITLLTSVDEAQKIQLLQTAHLLLAPSRYEGFGIPPIEAMAAHCPVVTTDCAAGNEIVHHEKTGLLVAYDDVAGYAAATVRILRDHALRRQLVAAAYAHVIQDYTPITVATQSLEYYQQCIATFRK